MTGGPDSDPRPRWRIDTIHAPTGDHGAWRDIPGRDAIEALDELRAAPHTPLDWDADMGAHVARWPCGSRALVFPQFDRAA